MAILSFLADLELRPWAAETPAIRANGYLLGRGPNPLEVALAESDRKPANAEVRGLWKQRHGGKASPLLLIVRYPFSGQYRAAICGPVGDEPPVVGDLEPSQAERLARAALEEPDRHAAIRFLSGTVAELDSELPGIRNEGMLATNELAIGVPGRSDWSAACKQGATALPYGGQQLVEALGFTIEMRGLSTWVLRTSGTASAIAVFLDQNETPEAVNPRFGGTTPVSYALAVADSEGLPYLVLTRGRHIRLYGARKNTGVGRKGRSETFIEANLALLPGEQAGYLPLLFGANALRPDGTFEQILEASRDYAADLGQRLRERVYNHVVPALAKSVAVRWKHKERASDMDLRWLFRQTLFILFRLLFLAYAEDKDLMPYRTNDRYRGRSLKTLARELAAARNRDAMIFDPNSTDLWERVRSLWTAVDKGNKGWGVPAYDGALFSSDPQVNGVGAALATLSLNDQEFGLAVCELLVDRTAESSYGPVDFRSLSVREFGTIYEGLLESDLSVAPCDLKLDEEKNYVPSKSAEQAVVREGEIYLHNRSGARKSSGSYFTKPQVVEHLLEYSLEPALSDHIARLTVLTDANDDAGVASAFFDFRCIDLSMGSGHFLVAAVDHIETRLSSFLATHPIPRVTAELERLRASALEALGPLASTVEIETASLLRRQVARRCVYGVDVNDVAVELARLSLWIHTFIPGLPLSFLNHSLVVGNSLTGVASLSEAVDVLDPGEITETMSGGQTAQQKNFVRDAIMAALGEAQRLLSRLALVSDANAKEIAEARKAVSEARQAAEPARRLMALAVAVRMNRVDAPTIFGADDLSHADLQEADRLSDQLGALHFPIAFPEVFLRERIGFDCVVGNPPWDKVRFEAQQFWVARAPGLNAVPASKREKEIEKLRALRPTDAIAEQAEQKTRELLQSLVDRAFEFQGRGLHGHHDLAKLFVERALKVLGRSGHLGYVLPRTALVLGGWADLRQALFHASTSTVVQARNKSGWIFEDIDYRLMIAFLSRGPRRSQEASGVYIWPSITRMTQLLKVSVDKAIFLSEDEIRELTDTLVLPWFSTDADREVFDSLREHSRLGRDDGWITGTADSSRWDFSGTGPHAYFVSTSESRGCWRVLMTRHVEPFRINNEIEFSRFIPKPADLVPLSLGLVNRSGVTVLGTDHPPIAYRYPTMNDNSRTLIATALPARGYLYSKGYVHGIRLLPHTTRRDVLALLGYLNSFTADWWVRRFTDRHMTLPVLHNLPLPDWDESSRERAAGLVEALLSRGGLTELFDASAAQESQQLKKRSNEDILAELEHLVLSGFSLSTANLERVLSDFSQNGCPQPLRERLLSNEY